MAKCMVGSRDMGQAHTGMLAYCQPLARLQYLSQKRKKIFQKAVVSRLVTGLSHR